MRLENGPRMPHTYTRNDAAHPFAGENFQRPLHPSMGTIEMDPLVEKIVDNS